MISMNTIPAEKSICSTLMFNSSIMEHLIDRLQPEHFFDQVCRDIFDFAMVNYLTNSPVTDYLVTQKFPDKEKEIVSIALTTPVSIDTVIMQADNIKAAYENRSMLAKLEEVKAAILEGRDYSIDDLKHTSSFDSSVQRTNKDIIAVMEDRIANPIKDHGTGLSEVDRYLNLEPGNLIVVAARPSMGKTGLVVSIILHLLDSNEGSAFFSLEMPAENIMLRTLSCGSGEALNDIRHNKLRDLGNYNRMKKLLEDADNFILLDKVVDHIQIYNMGMALIRRDPSIKNIFIDHLTYIKDPGGYANNHLRIGDVTKTLKRLAKDSGCKVWLLSQLNRGIESRPNKRPQLSDMRESGSIEEDADVILGIYRESYYTSREEAKREEPVNEVEILVLKNRDGEVGGAKTMFVGPKVKFTDNADGNFGAVHVVEYDYAEDDIDVYHEETGEIVETTLMNTGNINVDMPPI